MDQAQGSHHDRCRFRDHSQSEFYKNILKQPENRVVPTQWINWGWMQRQADPTFDKIRVECDRRQLTKLMGLGQNQNDEPIAQFYATLWIE